MSIVLFKYFIHFLYIFYMELINNKLELALSRLNIRQEDLGSIMGLSQSSVSLIKNGKRKTIPPSPPPTKENARHH